MIRLAYADPIGLARSSCRQTPNTEFISTLLGATSTDHLPPHQRLLCHCLRQRLCCLDKEWDFIRPMASAYPSKVDIWAPQCTRPLFNDTINSYTKVGKITKQKLLFTFFGPTIRQSRDKSVFFDKRKQFILNLQIFPNFTNPMRRRALQCDLLRPKFRYLFKKIFGAKAAISHVRA